MRSRVALTETENSLSARVILVLDVVQIGAAWFDLLLKLKMCQLFIV